MEGWWRRRGGGDAHTHEGAPHTGSARAATDKDERKTNRPPPPLPPPLEACPLKIDKS